MVTICSVQNCSSEGYRGCGISFYSMPKNPEMKKKWMRAMKKDKVCKKAVVCSRHFKKIDYEPYSFFCQVRRLKPDAVPSIFRGMPEWNEFRKHYVHASRKVSDEESEDQRVCNDDENVSDDEIFKDVDSMDLKGNDIEELNEGKKQKVLECNKMMVVAPIREITRIEDVITTIVNDTTASKSKVMVSKSKVMVVAPITKINRIEDVITTVVNTNASDSLTAPKQCSSKRNLTKFHPYKRLLNALTKEVNTNSDQRAVNKFGKEFLEPPVIKRELNNENNTVDNCFDNICISINSFHDINTDSAEDPLAIPIKTELEYENSSPVDDNFINVDSVTEFKNENSSQVINNSQHSNNDGRNDNSNSYDDCISIIVYDHKSL